jgi:hypothetical protein
MMMGGGVVDWMEGRGVDECSVCVAVGFLYIALVVYGIFRLFCFHVDYRERGQMGSTGDRSGCADRSPGQVTVGVGRGGDRRRSSGARLLLGWALS